MIPATRLWSLGSAAAVGVLLSACRDLGTVPLVATRMGFTAQPPASVVSTQPMAPVAVGFLTGDGRFATTFTGSVQISLITPDPAAHLSGTTTATAANGVATFSDLSVDKAGPAYRLVAKSAGFDSIVSSTFAVTAGSAVKLRLDDSAFRISP